MADNSPKGLALLLMSKKHPDMKEPADDDSADASAPAGGSDDTGSGSLVDCASDVMDAMKSGDPAQLAAALKDFCTLADDDTGSEAPPDASDNSEPAEQPEE